MTEGFKKRAYRKCGAALVPPTGHRSHYIYQSDVCSQGSSSEAQEDQRTTWGADVGILSLARLLLYKSSEGESEASSPPPFELFSQEF